MGKINNQLHVFANETTDWVVAYDSMDAIKVWEEYTGETYYVDEYGGLFVKEPDDKELTIEEEIRLGDNAHPVGVVVETGERFVSSRATMRAWADARGRCFLCSTEY